MLKLAYYKYNTKTMTAKVNYLNSAELKQIMALVYEWLIPAGSYFFNKILGAVSTRNNYVSSIFTICLVFYIVLCFSVTLFVAIPYIQEKKSVVFPSV